MVRTPSGDMKILVVGFIRIEGENPRVQLGIQAPLSWAILREEIVGCAEKA